MDGYTRSIEHVVSLTDIPPRTDALATVPPDEVTRLRVVPFGWDGERLLVAATRDADDYVHEQIRRLTGHTARLYLCTDVELEAALRRYYAEENVTEIRRVYHMPALLFIRALELVPADALRRALGRRVHYPDEDWLVWLEEQGHLTDAQRTALTAVRHGVPYMRTPRFDGNNGLTAIVPTTVAKAWRIVPFYADSHRVWVYTSAAQPIDDLDTLKQTIGLAVRPVVVTDTQWEHVYDRLYTGETPSQPPARPLDDLIVDSGWLTPAQKYQFREMRRRSDLAPAAVVQRAGWLDDGAWQHIRAEQWGLLPPATEQWRGMPVDEQLRHVRFPHPLARRRNVVPLYVADDGLHVGVDDPENADVLPALTAISRQHVHGHLLTPEQFESAWQRYYHDAEPQPAPLPPLCEWLHAGAYVTQAQLDEAEQYAAANEMPLGESLLALDVLDPLDLAEVLSVQSNIPWFPLEHVPAGLPLERRRALACMPTTLPLLELNGRSDNPATVLAGIADPYRPTTDAKGKAPAHVTPLLVPAPICRAAEAPATAEAARYDALLRFMAQRGYLTTEHLPVLRQRLTQSGAPLDVVLVPDFLDAERYVQAAAGFTGLDAVSLTPTYQQETYIDAVGRVRRRTLVDDPVSLPAARTLSHADAQTWCMLPIAQSEQGLTVALADPLDEPAREALAEVVAPLRITWVIASRNEIEAAISRTIGQKNIGTYLLEAGIITTEQLRDALELSQRVGVRIGRALTVLQYVTEEELVTFLAEQQNVPFFDLDDLSMLDHETVELLTEREARRWGAIPIAVDTQRALVAMVDPLDDKAIGRLEASLERDVEPVITTERAFERALEAVYREEYTYRSTQELVFRYPEESAYRVLNTGQKAGVAALVVISVLWLLWDHVSFLITFNALTTAFYVAFSVHRFYLVYRALSHDLEIPISAEEVDALDESDLPFYTILVPVYREAAVLPNLTRAIAALDYPLAKLDVKLLMEEDDEETIAAARALDLPPNFQHIVLPHSEPKTKPKACNYGLLKARGEYVVIFDAEDLPEPDQLKKIIVAFEQAGDDVVCIQAKLNYYNRQQNLLTRWFTTEYSMWFDLFLPGLDASNAPVPLGGTSNHFRRDRLEELGAWDPFNVTEDADLGVRLFKAGYRTGIVDTTTFEEANSDLHNWIRQRSRWVKGYIQTWLVHMRHPIALWRAIGTKAFLGFNLTVGGTFVGYLLNPLYWALTTLWFLTEWGLIQQIFPALIFYLGGINLYLGNFVFTYMNVAGTMRRGFYDMVKYALLSPIYWALMSIGAWKGFLQLIHKPFYWEKTVHGLYKGTPNLEEARELGDLL